MGRVTAAPGKSGARRRTDGYTERWLLQPTLSAGVRTVRTSHMETPRRNSIERSERVKPSGASACEAADLPCDDRSSPPRAPRKSKAVPSKAIVGEKVGMTQVWDDQNRAIAVTVVRVTPVRVVQLKTPDRDGYSALQDSMNSCRAAASSISPASRSVSSFQVGAMAAALVTRCRAIGPT